MIIRNLSLKDGMDTSYDYFSNKRNLIFSKSNTKGKTTYLRLLFYSLGYPIPSMKGIDFGTVETSLKLEEKGLEYQVERIGNHLTLMVNNESYIYTLPSEHSAFLSNIFQYENIKVLDNLLGFMYIDQDKGWSLLNRGTVIGKIKFSIEELLSGLNNIDISDLLDKRKNLKFNKDKYTALLNIQELSEQVYEKNGEIFISDIEREYSEKISYINLQISNLKQTLKELTELSRKEEKFFDYIDSMKLQLKKEYGNVPVNRDTLANVPASTEYLKARISIVVTDIEKLVRVKKVLESKISEYNIKNSQISLFETISSDEIIDKKIATIGNVDQKLIVDLIDKVNDELRIVNKNIRDAVKYQNEYITKVYNYVYKYAEKLKVEEKMVHKEDYIFTSDLKSMSGAVLQKMVFAFKIAFLKVIEESMNTKLFIVIDSPKGKELDDDNTKLIMNLINDELKDNQVFIASIYDFENENKIELYERAIEIR